MERIYRTVHNARVSKGHLQPFKMYYYYRLHRSPYGSFIGYLLV